MPNKHYPIDVVVPKSDTKAGPGLEKLRTMLDEETDPLAALNAEKEKRMNNS